MNGEVFNADDFNEDFRSGEVFIYFPEIDVPENMEIVATTGPALSVAGEVDAIVGITGRRELVHCSHLYQASDSTRLAHK